MISLIDAIAVNPLTALALLSPAEVIAALTVFAFEIAGLVLVLAIERSRAESIASGQDPTYKAAA